MVSLLHGFFALSESDQMIYVVGRRMGLYRGLGDLGNQEKRRHVENCCSRYGITPENLDDATDELMKRFI